MLQLFLFAVGELSQKNDIFGLSKRKYLQFFVKLLQIQAI